MDVPGLYASGKSIPDIARETGLPRSCVRTLLLSSGTTLRSRAEAILLAKPKLGSGLRGKKRPPFSDEHKKKLSVAKLAHADIHAKGTRITSNGYVEYTRGENKGRSVHVVLMEKRLGRKLLLDENVHHIDGNRTNNDLSNLALVTKAAHSRLHRMQKRMAANTNGAK